MNSSLAASPAVQLAKARSEHNEVVRIDSEINSPIKAVTDAQLSSGWKGVWSMEQQFGVTLDGGNKKGWIQSWQKHANQRLKSPPTSCPSEKIHGGGWAGCGKGASNHGREEGCRRSTRSSSPLFNERRLFCGLTVPASLTVFVLYLCFVWVFVFAL